MAFPKYLTPCPEGVIEHVFEVKKEQTDTYGYMRVSDLARQMEKITEAHLASFGIDRMSLKDEGKAWVISWSTINIEELPKEGDKITLRMWPGKNKSVMYARKYVFYSEIKKPLVSAASLFIMMDLNTRNVAVPSKKVKQIPIINIPDEADLPKMREVMPVSFSNTMTRNVQLTEIDKNGHMNNTCYLDWADEIRKRENCMNRIPGYVWIQYSKELQEGQEVVLQYESGNEGLSLSGSCEQGESFALKMTFLEKKERKENMSFIDTIIKQAKLNKQRIAVPEYKNEYMMKAAVKANADGIADIVIVGDPAEVKEYAKNYGLDLTGIKIADATDESYKEALLDRYAAMPTKVMPRAFIAKRLKDSLYLATLMEAVGEVDATIAGVDTTTFEFVLAANSIIGMEPGCPSASGSLIMEIDGWEGEQGNVFACSDGAVCISPTIEQHAYIAIGTAETFEAITGEKARCAFLSYSTDGSGGSSEPVKKVRAAVELAQKTRPDLAIDGEFQADAAIDYRVGKKKVKRDSEVAGQANVLIFPDAAACNICTKMVQRLGGARVFGPLYQGFRKPILDCSRSDTDDILYNDMALLSVLAAAKK